MLRKLKIWYLNQQAKKTRTYLVNGYIFRFEKITVKQYAQLVKLIDKIFSEKSAEPGTGELIGGVLLKFEKLAHIIFASQDHVDEIDWNDIDGNLAYRITADVIKKNPNLMLHLKRIINSFGLDADRLVATLRSIMQQK